MFDFKHKKHLQSSPGKLLHSGAGMRILCVMKKIIVHVRLNGVPGRNELNGIFRYLARKEDWDFRIVQDEAALEAELRQSASGPGRPDGFIISAPVSDDICALVGKNKVPTVLLDIHPSRIPRRKKNLAFIRNDDGGIGLAAAKHLMSLGNFRSYAFIHAKDRKPWSERRGEAFAFGLAKRGHTPKVYRANSLPDAEDRIKLAAFLSRLEKPAAVFAAWDERAVQTLECCHDAKIAVPEEMALLGVDDEILCDHTKPPLASIRPDNTEEGFKAAEALDLMIRGKPAPTVVTCRIKGVVERESASAIAPGGHLVRQALAFIAANAATNLKVRDVVAHLGVSRRLADQRFHQFQKESILSAITRARVEELKRRLRETDAPIGRITADCGFLNASYAKTLFLSKVGQTMTAYRNAKQALR